MFISETTFYVRYAETDAMGIVHHSQYVIYCEEGRSAYARERGSAYSSIEESGFYLTVTGVNLRYIQPARYEQLITVRTWISDVKSRALTFEYEIVDTETGSRLVTGSSNHVCITHEGKIARVPDSWRAWK